MQFTVTSIPANQVVPGLSFWPSGPKASEQEDCQSQYFFSFSKCVTAFKVVTENSALYLLWPGVQPVSKAERDPSISFIGKSLVLWDCTLILFNLQAETSPVNQRNFNTIDQ